MHHKGAKLCNDCTALHHAFAIGLATELGNSQLLMSTINLQTYAVTTCRILFCNTGGMFKYQADLFLDDSNTYQSTATNDQQSEQQCSSRFSLVNQSKSSSSNRSCTRMVPLPRFRRLTPQPTSQEAKFMSERKGVQQLTNGGKKLLMKQGQDHKMINFWGRRRFTGSGCVLTDGVKNWKKCHWLWGVEIEPYTALETLHFAQ